MRSGTPSSQGPTKTLSTAIAATDTHSRRLYWLLFACITLLLCLPVWSTEYIPLVDYPNHLARVNILYHYNDVAPYQAMYYRLLEPLPNLAIDLIAPPLLKFFEIKIAGKIFITLTILLFNIGCHLLGKAIHGRPTWLALPCTFFNYNSMFFYGFLNYMFGLGMFLLTLAVWLKYRKGWNLTWTVVVSLLVFISYLAHLSSYSFLFATMLTVTFFDFLSVKTVTKKMLLSLLPLLPPLLAFAAYARSSGETKQIYFNGPYRKAVALLSLIISYDYLLDCVLLSIVFISLLVLVCYIKNWQIKWPIFTAASGFAALFLICPEGLFQSGSADARFVPPAIILAILALSFEINKRVGQYVLGILLLVSLVRLGSIWYEWRKLDEKIAAQVAMFSNFEEGAKVYPITLIADTVRNTKLQRPFTHVIHYSTLYRHTFSPTLLAVRGAQPVVFKDKQNYLAASIESLPSPETVNWDFIFRNYDYLWCYRINSEYIQYLKERCQLVAEANECMIFRINKQALARMQARFR